VRVEIAPGGIENIGIASGALVRALNGLAIIGGANANYSLGTDAMIWDEPSGTFPVGAVSILSGSMLVVEVCPMGIPATATPSPTVIWTPGIGSAATAYCVPLDFTATVIAYAMPDLSLIIPHRVSPTATITNSTTLSATALIAFQQTISAGVVGPAAGIATISAEFSWQSGQAAGATNVAMAAPALEWMALINPVNPAWDADGGPLWAIAPVFRPIMPVLVILIMAVIARYGLWIMDWFIKLGRLLIQVIKLLPFL
jgi:hypothetical protein